MWGVMAKRGGAGGPLGGALEGGLTQALRSERRHPLGRGLPAGLRPPRRQGLADGLGAPPPLLVRPRHHARLTDSASFSPQPLEDVPSNLGSGRATMRAVLCRTAAAKLG